TRSTAVINSAKFKVPEFGIDSLCTIQLKEHRPNFLKYESQSTANGLAVFSEIYYPKGWKAFIDGTESEIIQANYVLRALSIPSGKHTIEFKFAPDAYVIGNKVTMASSWLTLLILLGSLGWSLKKDE
ncbi:MAG TPA: YfhO family protein, partial [Ohtaekwangia sp.]